VVQEETSSAPDDTVMHELQRGYRLRDRVLRPALVSVARNPGQPAPPAQED
jgi:molecular chaperone GrpE